jgi:hypothetical protein
MRQARYWAKECLQFAEKQGKTTVQKNQQRWQKPVDDTLKINTDGSFDAETRQGGWGFVIRDSTGEARGSGAGHLYNVASALQAETLACSEAVHAAAEWGMGTIHLETDSMILACALQTSEYDLAPEGVLFRDLRIFIRLNFLSHNISFVSRDCNNVAHLLAARGARQVEVRLWWPDDVPDDVISVVTSESAVSS